MFDKVKMNSIDISKYHTKLIKNAKRGSTNSMFKLAIMYKCGIGIEKNYQKTIKLLEKAIELKNSNAMVALAIMYEHGSGVDQNNEQAIKLYKKAIELNNTTAMRELAKISDHRDALELYTTAILLGDTYAMYELGCYFDSLNNHEMAMVFFKQAVISFENQYNHKHYFIVDDLIDAYKHLEMWFPIANLCLNHSGPVPIRHKKQIFIHCIDKIIMTYEQNFEDFINIINHKKFDEIYDNNPPQIVIELRNLYKK